MCCLLIYVVNWISTVVSAYRVWWQNGRCELKVRKLWYKVYRDFLEELGKSRGKNAFYSLTLTPSQFHEEAVLRSRRLREILVYRLVITRPPHQPESETWKLPVLSLKLKGESRGEDNDQSTGPQMALLDNYLMTYFKLGKSSVMRMLMVNT